MAGVDLHKMKQKRRARGRTKLTGWKDRIPWGKYEGETVEDILADDPRYLRWIVRETDMTDFDPVIKDKIEERAAEADPDFYDYPADFPW